MLITAETAREMAKRSVEARAAKKEELAQSLAAAQAQTSTGDSVEDLARAKLETELKNAQNQVALLSKRLTNALEDDGTPPIDVERLQRSLSSAREDERKLAGRSLPPTVKAAQVKPSRRQGPMSEPS